jgi:poly-beta-1,6 N-acetyl-D-glucosamine synthase
VHWIVLGLVVVGLVLALLLAGYEGHAVRPSSTGSLTQPSQPALTGSGSVLDLSGAAVRSRGSQGLVVALTFDDGPDPTWTPQVLAVLRRHRVPATFFVVGSRVTAHPGLVRAELATGAEIGSHTFAHADVTGLSGWRTSLELSLTQTALAGAAGIHTGLFRPPYSSTPDAVRGPNLAAYRRVGGRGYLVVLSDRDSEDWRRPGVGQVLANATPAPGAGGIVLFHDGGGNRAQTVLAVDLLITNLQAKGYTFTTVSGLAGLRPGVADAHVSTWQRLQGRALLIASYSARLAVQALDWLIWPLLVITLARALLVLVLARRHARRRDRRPVRDSWAPPVSVIIPAYNEEKGIAETVRSVATSAYPEVEVIVIDDGSTDRTAAVARALGLPNVTVVSQANRGKPAALNAGVELARHDVIVCVDADTVFAHDTIRWLVRRLANPLVGAVSGNTKVGNRGGLLGRWQHVEYVMGFNLDRRMYELLDCMPTVPGAVGAFRREALSEAGGFSDDTLAEDTDVTMAINRAGWRVVYEERAVAWTEAPATLGDLWRQRYRWCYGTLQAMWKHRRSSGRGRRDHIRRRALPYLLVFQVLLPLLAPVIDLFALYGLLFLRPAPVLAAWAGFNVLQLAMGVAAFRLDREPLGPLWSVPLEQFLLRQLMYLVVIQSVVTAVAGVRLRWHKLARTGEARPDPERPSPAPI